MDTIHITLSNGRAWYLSTAAVAFVAIMLTGAVLRLVALGDWSLWLDELHTLHVITQAQLTTTGVPGDQHPPLYYLLLQGWLALGDAGEFWLRLPSAIAGILAIPLMWSIGVTLGSRKLGLLAAALLTVSPLHIWYAREARMYGLASFFWVASIYFYLQTVRRDSWLDSVGLAAATLAGLLTAYPTFALWLGEISLFFLFWTWTGRPRRRLVRWLAAQAVIVTGFAFWWPFLQLQLARGSLFFWQLPGMPVGFTGTLEQTLQLALVLGGVTILLLIALSLIVTRHPALAHAWQRHLPLVMMGLVMVFIGLTLLGALPRALSVRRQLLVFWPPLVLLAAWALERWSNRLLTAGTLTLSLVLSLAMLLGPPYEDWRGLTNLVAAEAQPGDRIWLTPSWFSRPFAYYYQGRVDYENVDVAQLEDRPPVPGDRIWLVTTNHPSLDAYTGNVKSWLHTRADLEATVPFARFLEVRVYRMKE